MTNEEATKAALILPLFSLLGYDVLDAHVLFPQYTVKEPGQPAQRIDYVLHTNGRPCLIIECKPCKQSLTTEHVTQLAGYFALTNVHFGLLTNGIQYHFYADAEEADKLDETPFLTVDLSNPMESDLQGLRLFMKKNFSEAAILKKIPYLRKIVTTEEERMGWQIVKDILQHHVDVERITPIDTMRYCSLVLDHTPNKRICHIWWGKRRKQLSLFNTGKERKIPIQSLDDLHRYETELIATVDRHKEVQ